jgi:hypothetical protein
MSRQLSLAVLQVLSTFPAVLTPLTMVDQNRKAPPSIPSWQQSWQSGAKESSVPPTDQPASTPDPTPAASPSQLLEDQSIRNASREQKFDFLQKQGLKPDEIEELLGAESVQPVLPPSSDDTHDAPELKTIHDTSQDPTVARDETSPPPSTLIEEDVAPSPSQPSTTTSSSPKRDIPPIITYPEFLLKPQKPPPLVTFERLANAAYAIAGVSALTWSMSKYIVQPMLESLTEARHSLAETAKADLETLNAKLEATVSHVPYIPSLFQQQQNQHPAKDDDLDSETSDPTELFHRDIATQTSPHPSRTQSLSSLTSLQPTAKDPTTTQSTRLRSLHSTLSSLLSSQTTHFSQDRLSTTMTDFQSTLDKLESSYNPFSIDHASSSSFYSSYSGPGALGTDGKAGDAKAKKPDASEASKFKNEIRSLKGAFLSSRNFPTARPAQPFTLPTR